MPRPGLRSAAAAIKGRRPETEVRARDDREAAGGGNERPGRPKRQRTGSRQLRSGASGPPEESADAATPSRKRRMTVELRAPHPSPKRRRGADPQPTGDDDEGEEAAPDSQAFYDSINKHSGAAGDTTVRPEERHSDSLQAEEQLQSEYRDRAEGAGEGGRPQGPEAMDEPPRTSKQSRGARGENAGPAARNSRHAPSKSVDLGSDSPSPHQAPGGADEAEERPSESDGEGQESDEEQAETARISLDLPHGSEAPPVVDVVYGGLPSVIKLINRPGWAHGSAEELPPKPDEGEGAWWTRVKEHLKPKQCEPLYKDMFRLLRFYQETPRAPDFGAQIDHLGRHKDDVETMLNSIDGVVGEILADILKLVDAGGDGKPSRRAKRAKSIYEGIMPMLILCLREAFLVGGGSAKTPLGGSFTACTLQPLCLITAWFVGLYDSMHAALATGPERPGGESQHGKPGAADRNREGLRKRVESFHDELERATADLKKFADGLRRRQEATEQDGAIKAFRATRERKRQEARELQMQRFFDWRRQDTYFARHGWHLWEDERLLDMVRQTVTPPMHELAASVPGRSEAEVGPRVRQLKESMRHKFEAMGEVPPRWCFDG